MARLAEALADLSMPEPNSGCLLWLGAVSNKGYGTFGKASKAHRLSWLAHRGAIPDGLHVLHKCDVRCCVNPDHLWLGTNADNIADKIRKGRHVSALHRAMACRGEKHGMAKLSAKQVAEIRVDARAQSAVAREYGVTQAMVSRIKLRKAWAHI